MSSCKVFLGAALSESGLVSVTTARELCSEELETRISGLESHEESLSIINQHEDSKAGKTG